MATPIRFLENPPLHGLDPESGSMHYDGTVDFSKMVAGDMAYYHHRGAPCRDRAILDRLHLTAYYFAHNAGRPPLILAIPDHSSKSPLYFLVDAQCYSSQCVRCGTGWRKHKWDDVGNKNRCADGGEYNPKGHYDGWTVSGEPPKITVSPSVDFDNHEEGIRRYHGHVQNGVIGDG